MPQKKHKPEEIVAKLRQVDVLLSQGRSVGEAYIDLCEKERAYQARLNERPAENVVRIAPPRGQTAFLRDFAQRKASGE